MSLLKRPVLELSKRSALKVKPALREKAGADRKG
jgi:hypothetical protein